MGSDGCHVCGQHAPPLRDRYYHNLRVFYWISVNFTVIKISNTAWTARSFPLSIPKIPHNKTETKHCEYTQIRGCVLLPSGRAAVPCVTTPFNLNFPAAVCGVGGGWWGRCSRWHQPPPSSIKLCVPSLLVYSVSLSVVCQSQKRRAESFTAQ